MQQLRDLGVDVRDADDIFPPRRYDLEPGDPKLRYGHAVADKCRNVKEILLDSYAAGRLPMTIGGDHSLSIGTLAAFLTRHDPAECAVLWIDAHGDINTPSTTPSGNSHGMVLGAALGRPSGLESECKAAIAWQRLLDLYEGRHLPPSGIFWIGLRELDNEEKRAILDMQTRPARTMSDIDQAGIKQTIIAALSQFRRAKAKYLHLSIDVDVLDPEIAPGTGTKVPGGLSYREAHLATELIYEEIIRSNKGPELVSLDVVEIDPLEDTQNRTARLAVELICSIFGKSILPLVE
jgi:arginase